MILFLISFYSFSSSLNADTCTMKTEFYNDINNPINKVPSHDLLLFNNVLSGGRTTGLDVLQTEEHSLSSEQSIIAQNISTFPEQCITKMQKQ
jgi:hypothetical protein